jgi:drug/metabolite transporter (DMT)-like permease
MVLLGVLAALLYGSGDFFGALAAKRSPAVAVVLWSQLVGVALLVMALPLLPAAHATPGDLGWGVLAGFAGASGMVLLYAGLASGAMGVVAPVTAVAAALVPVIGGSLLGETLGGTTLVGIALGLAAVTLLSLVPPEVPAGVRVVVVAEAGLAAPRGHHRRDRRALLMGLGAGTAFGLFFLALDQAGDDAGLWPLFGARASSLALLLVAGLVSARGLAVGRAVRPHVALAGALDMGANVAFLLATQRGAVGVVAVLVALAPGATVVLARVVLHERLRPLQLAGLATAAASVVLIALA